ncbi:MAG: hypothetical protein Q7T89_17525, partial [Anaerolineales bacterium]|nr:hypothetical protein [Anaerolineales bacterium]
SWGYCCRGAGREQKYRYYHEVKNLFHFSSPCELHQLNWGHSCPGLANSTTTYFDFKQWYHNNITHIST